MRERGRKGEGKEGWWEQVIKGRMESDSKSRGKQGIRKGDRRQSKRKDYLYVMTHLNLLRISSASIACRLSFSTWLTSSVRS